MNKKYDAVIVGIDNNIKEKTLHWAILVPWNCPFGTPFRGAKIYERKLEYDTDKSFFILQRELKDVGITIENHDDVDLVWRQLENTKVEIEIVNDYVCFMELVDQKKKMNIYENDMQLMLNNLDIIYGLGLIPTE